MNNLCSVWCVIYSQHYTLYDEQLAFYIVLYNHTVYPSMYTIDIVYNVMISHFVYYAVYILQCYMTHIV